MARHADVCKSLLGNAMQGSLMRMLMRLHLELEFTDFCQGEENQAVGIKPAGFVHIPAA